MADKIKYIFILLIALIVVISSGLTFLILDQKKKIDFLKDLYTGISADSVEISGLESKVAEVSGMIDQMENQNPALENRVSESRQNLAQIKSNIIPISSLSLGSSEVKLFKKCDGTNFYNESTSFSTDSYSSKALIYLAFKNKNSYSSTVRVKVYKLPTWGATVGNFFGKDDLYSSSGGNSIYYSTINLPRGNYFAKLYTTDYSETYLAGSKNFSVYQIKESTLSFKHTLGKYTGEGSVIITIKPS